MCTAVGCPDMAAPANAWIERSEERMIVRCNYSLETWYLTCKGNDWIGTFTNCTDGNYCRCCLHSEYQLHTITVTIANQINQSIFIARPKQNKNKNEIK